VAKTHPTIRAAGRELEFPDWAVANRRRRDHCARVGQLMRSWAKTLDLGKKEARRWRAAGLLHDALKDADPESLRAELTRHTDWPAPLLHGPASAEWLQAEGVEDEEFLRAIAYHTTGHPDFGRIGQALYLADYLEPGRGRSRRRDAWRARLPAAWSDVLIEVAASKIRTLLTRGLPIPAETTDFWNRITG
jgi:2-amino-4-hydroxy-6-hydroxymethyldihydropteridine diphosphokinase